MTGLRYSPLHVTELCGEMQGNFKVGCARLIISTLLILNLHLFNVYGSAIASSDVEVLKVISAKSKSTKNICIIFI